MGKAQERGGIIVRYVSPVTARLFAKMGSKALGLPSGEVLAPLAEIDGSRSGGRGGGGHTPAAWRQAPKSEGMAGTAEAAPPPVNAGGGAGETKQHRVEVVRQYLISAVNGAAATCPQAYLESILKDRGYDCTVSSSASEGCRCEPSQKQIDDYQVPLLEAVRRWDMDALRELAANGVDMGAANRFGESVVHLATRTGSAPVLEFLLAHGASIKICDDYGKTPLHDAFWTGEPRFDLVSMLLEKDWRLLRAADVRGATPLRYAKQRHWGLWCDFLDRVKDQHWPWKGGDGGGKHGDDEGGEGAGDEDGDDGKGQAFTYGGDG